MMHRSRVLFSIVCVSVTLTACFTSSHQDVRVTLDAWSSKHQLRAWRDRAIVVAPASVDSYQVRAFSPEDGAVWERKVDCPSSDIIADGLLCVGKSRVVALSGKDGGNLWVWKAPIEVDKVHYEGARLTVQGKDGARHTIDSRNGHAVAPGPIGARLFTSGGALSITVDNTSLLAHRYENGEPRWSVLRSLWPFHHLLLHHILFQGTEPDGGRFLALLDSESRLVLRRVAGIGASKTISLRSNPQGVLAIQEEKVTALRPSGIQRLPRSREGQAWALGQRSVISVDSAGGSQDLVWRFSGHQGLFQRPPTEPNQDALSRPGVTLHGAWLSKDKELTHLEVRVKRWSPDLLYAWRTEGPWTARRISPEAAGDRGLNPAFDGDQPFSPMPLWFSPVTVSELAKTGLARVGKLSLTMEGWSYHRLIRHVGKVAQGTISFPVMVVSRADNGDRYWIAPNGPNPLLLRAERDGGTFYLAGMSLPEDLGR